MKLAFALLMMTSALVAGSAADAAGQGASPTAGASLLQRMVPGADLTLIDDDENEGGGWLWFGSHDDDGCGGDDDEGADDDDGGEGCSAGAAGNAAKAGSAPPPKNGLFTDGTAPVVKSN